MNKFKKWLIPLATICIFLVALVGCSNAPASLGETFDPSGNPFANRFSDVKDIRTATFVVAASDSEHKFEADYFCDATDDHVQINAALNALPATGGKVVLLDGTFNIVDPITFPKNKITLEGQGRSTFIDGDALATNEHGISMTGRDDCVVRNLAIQTQDGGGKTCNCIWIEDGSDRFVIEGVTIVDSDRNGIAIDGTNIVEGYIVGCFIEDVDNAGIITSMDVDNYVYRLRIHSNYIAGGAGCAISLTDAVETNIIGNTLQNCDDSLIVVYQSDYTLVEGNLCKASTWSNGISLDESDWCQVIGNTVTGSGVNGISLCVDSHCIIKDNFIQGSLQYGICMATANHCIVGGNEIIENSQDSDNTYDGIVLSTSDYNLITGNIIRRGALANKHQYGINIYDDASDRNCLIGNDLYDSGSTGDLNDVPTTNPTLKHDNRNLAGTGWLPEV